MDIAKLALEDGTVFTGRGFGASGETEGEVVFNTSMTGYQEILTDPSYHGQIVAMTYPMIGNYGINLEDAESARPWVRAFVVRELSRISSNHRSGGTLEAYLTQNGVIGIEGIDTRALVRLTRNRGSLKGIVSTVDLDDNRLVERAKASPGLVGRDLTAEVMATTSTAWEPGFIKGFESATHQSYVDQGQARPHVVALDFGMKWNIPRHLVESGCRVTVVPGSAPAEEILEHQPDGIFLSNGPGDPSALTQAVSTLRTLIKDAAESRGTPIFGICLGHQLLGQAFGGRTFKLKFGHRGANHPVRNEKSGKIEITTRTTVSPSILARSRPRSSRATSNLKRPDPGRAPTRPTSRLQRFSIIPKPRRDRMIAATCSASSAKKWCLRHPVDYGVSIASVN